MYYIQSYNRYKLIRCILVYLGLMFYLVSGAQTFSLSGTVAGNNQEPVYGADIILDSGQKSTISDSEGKFGFAEISSGKHIITVSAMGFKDYIETLTVDSAHTILYVDLQRDVKELEEVSINSNKSDKLNRTASISVQLISEEMLKEYQTGNLTQSLSQIPGLQSMDIGTGISKPMIRGMSYYRVVVAENGIKQEGQQWSNHHGISIDHNKVNHVEVIKGPASLQYGSDAIGGVINILPHHVPLSEGINGEISLIGRSNTRWFGASGQISARVRDVYINTILTHNNYGDIRIPKTDTFWLPTPGNSIESSHPVTLGEVMHNTAGEESAANITLGIVKAWGNSYFDFSFHSNKYGFFDWEGLRNEEKRHTHAENLHDIEVPFQKVTNYGVKHFTNKYFDNGKLETALGFQNHISEEYTDLSDSIDIGLGLATFTANINYISYFFDNQTIIVGVNSQYQDHKKFGYGHILPKFEKSALGSYVIYKSELNKKIKLNAGARYDYNLFEMQRTAILDDSLLNPQFKKAYPGFSFSTGLNYHPTRKISLKLNFGKSYRVPSAYELGAFGLHRHAGKFEKGDTSNKPEQAWQMDLGLNYNSGRTNFSLSPFINYFTNYLYSNPTPNIHPKYGQIYEFRQNVALLIGGECIVEFPVGERLTYYTGAESVYAVNLDLHKPIPSTPPFSVKPGLTYEFSYNKRIKDAEIGMEGMLVAAQKYVITNELPTPGYFSMNIKVSAQLILGKQKVNLKCHVTNVFDNKHYNHLSFNRRLRIPEPGRDVQIYINIPF